MRVNEFAKTVPAPGFFARFFGKKVSSYALGITMGAQSIDKVDEELAAARKPIQEWIARRETMDFILVTAYAPQAVCDAILQRVKMLRDDAEIAPLIQGLPIEFSFNGKQKANA
jgi:hypothetical protein